jgi:hypothetical protein
MNEWLSIAMIVLIGRLALIIKHKRFLIIRHRGRGLTDGIM